MPKPPILQNEHARSIAVATSMAVLFAVSMGLAVVMSGPRGTILELDQLSIAVPDGWRQPTSPSPVAGFTPQVTLQSPGDPLRVLFVGGLTLNVPQSPVVVLRFTVGKLARANAQGAMREQPPQPIRGTNFTGVVWTALDQRDDQVQYHQVAVVSRDGQKHWVIYLLGGHVEHPNIHADMAEDAALFESILASAALAEPGRS